jgi:hypothetical protein
LRYLGRILCVEIWRFLQKTAIANVEKSPCRTFSAADYFSAAQYFYQSNGDINKSEIYMIKALELSAEKPFYY